MSPVGTIDWGGTWIRAALIEEGVRVSEIARARRPDSASRQIELVAGLLDALSEGSARPDAVGVGVAGVVREGGRIASAGNLGLGGAELQADLAARLALPVRVVNDTQAAALAEARASGRAGTLVLLSVGTGIGGAIVADGRLVPGRGAAGDFGHTPVMLDGPRCICGGSGCLEQVVSGRVLDEVARTLAGRGESSFLAELAKDRPPHGGDLEDAAADGDPAARQALEQAAGALVTGLRAVAAALDPDVIVLGGGLIRPASRLFELVAAGWERAHLPWTEATLECARLGDEAGLLGAALLFSEQGSGRGPRGLA